MFCDKQQRCSFSLIYLAPSHVLGGEMEWTEEQTLFILSCLHLWKAERLHCVKHVFLIKRRLQTGELLGEQDVILCQHLLRSHLSSSSPELSQIQWLSITEPKPRHQQGRAMSSQIFIFMGLISISAPGDVQQMESMHNSSPGKTIPGDFPLPGEGFVPRAGQDLHFMAAELEGETQF